MSSSSSKYDETVGVSERTSNNTEIVLLEGLSCALDST